MGRAPCCDKANVKKGPWSPEEDAKLKSHIEKHGTGGNWIALPQKIGLKRCGKSSRLRWMNYLRPNIKHGGFTEDEDNLICSLYTSIGSRWSTIEAQLPGRTDNDIKNYWNTRLKRKLLGKQRREQQVMRESSSVFKQLENKKARESYSINDNFSPPPFLLGHPVHENLLHQPPSNSSTDILFVPPQSVANLSYGHAQPDHDSEEIFETFPGISGVSCAQNHQKGCTNPVGTGFHDINFPAFDIIPEEMTCGMPKWLVGLGSLPPVNIVDSSTTGGTTSWK